MAEHSEATFAEWMEAAMEAGTRHTKALPPASRWERLYYRIFGVNPQSVVDRRMTALLLDEAEARAFRARNPMPKL